ncbi:hypothetical protein Rsub_01126 [Raphidocelis subcapitata]|uniref:G-patch domain-containing protein n=1 Tax=Raphidocelis subcapitata TaxID=307507 RepID=A0A2V0NLU3_9CHLO|nr:hypothetical protein Rsub_01126 [Raphidocelis subcapitata]|eukprot:GBF88414.1 hypothetical protein Rsub_01126 [Raphidocelis subcapitata]
MSDEPPKPGGGLGFSLAAAPKKRGKVQVQVAEQREERQLITGIEGTRIKGAAPEGPAAGPRVIAAVANTYRAGVGRGGGAAGRGSFVPSFVPPSSEDALASTNEERFVTAPKDDGAQAAAKKYGLQRMGAAADEQQGQGQEQEQGQGQGDEQQQEQERQRDGGRGRNGAAAAPAAALPARGRGGDRDALMADLEELPEEMAPEDYEVTPVDEFAKALLRGMGWRDGEGVGRSKAAVEVKQIVPRPERLGLGADPAALPEHLKKPRVVRMGDKPKQDLVAPLGPDGRRRHRVGLDEALVPREETLPGPRPGKEMRIAGGRHAGLGCVVRELLPKQEGRSDRALVRLHPSNEEVEVRCSDLGELGDAAASSGKGGAGRGGPAEVGTRSGDGGRGERERERDRDRDGSGSKRPRHGERDDGDRDGSGKRRRGESRERDGGGGGGSGGGRDERRPGHHHRHHHHSSKHDRHRRDGGGSSSSSSETSSSDGEPAAPPPPRRPTWLFPSIRVRILDKRLRGGALYLKKGVVVDVHPGGLADVALQEPRAVVQLPEGQLETVLPKEAGRPVQVVAGPWRGRRGRLLQARAGGGVAAVQLAGGAMEVVRLALDDVAEFTGALEEEEDA